MQLLAGILTFAGIWSLSWFVKGSVPFRPQGDDGAGTPCAGAQLGTAQEASVSGQPGSIGTAVALNAGFFFNNTVNDSFAFLFDARPKSLTNTPLSDEFDDYALPLTILASLASKRPTGVRRAGKEIVEEFASFEQARNRALEIIGEIGSASRSANVGKFGAFKGAVTGFTTRVAGVAKSFRIDWDPEKGAHVNVTVGKTKYALKFPGTEDFTVALTRRNVGK